MVAEVEKQPEVHTNRGFFTACRRGQALQECQDMVAEVEKQPEVHTNRGFFTTCRRGQALEECQDSVLTGFIALQCKIELDHLQAWPGPGGVPGHGGGAASLWADQEGRGAAAVRGAGGQ